MMRPKTAWVGLRLDAETFTEIAQHAERQGRPVSNLIRAITVDWLREQSTDGERVERAAAAGG
jgi:hypothetical protein